MKTEVFTLAIGEKFKRMAQEMAMRFKFFNGLDVTILVESDCAKFGYSPSYWWVKSCLWDLTSKDTDRIIWIDADILPIDRFPEYASTFAARLDAFVVNDKLDEGLRATEAYKLVNLELRSYVNAGFFIASRMPIILDLFTKWRACASLWPEPKDLLCDQTMLNFYLQQLKVDVTLINPNQIYMVDKEARPPRTQMKMRHYTHGAKDKFFSELWAYPLEVTST